LGLLETNVLTALGEPLGEVLDGWRTSERRSRLRSLLQERDGMDPDDVIMPPDRARAAGLAGTMAFLTGNLAPEGSVVKSTSIDPSLFEQGRFHHVGPAKVFTDEVSAMRAIKGRGDISIEPGDVIVLAGCGPMGSGMEETYQLTSALKFLPWGKKVALVTDARFSGVSTGVCIGHVGPEALAGGPLGKVHDGDLIDIAIDPSQAAGSLDLVGTGGEFKGREWGTAELARRRQRSDLHEADRLPDDTRLWALLQSLSGGTWGGCVYDVESIREALTGGRSTGRTN
jgi:xylonate dehydratase